MPLSLQAPCWNVPMQPISVKLYDLDFTECMTALVIKIHYLSSFCRIFTASCIGARTCFFPWSDQCHVLSFQVSKICDSPANLSDLTHDVIEMLQLFEYCIPLSCFTSCHLQIYLKWWSDLKRWLWPAGQTVKNWYFSLSCRLNFYGHQSCWVWLSYQKETVIRNWEPGVSEISVVIYLSRRNILFFPSIV